MEQLRTELSHLLGEKLSRVECVSEQAATALWFLYDAQGNPMPLLAPVTIATLSGGMAVLSINEALPSMRPFHQCGANLVLEHLARVVFG